MKSGTTRLIMHAKIAMDERIRTGVAELREQGMAIDTRITWEPGDAQRYALGACQDKSVSRVVAGGGDGTVNDVVSGMLLSKVKNLPDFAVMPMGTANDFARACNIPAQDPVGSLQLLLQHPARAVDVGRVNKRFFLNVATGGFGTDITVNTSPELKKLLGGAAYLLTGLSKMASITANQAKIHSAEESWEGGFLALAIGNGRFAGGGIPLCGDALIDDGQFDLCLLPDVTTEKIPEVLKKLLEKGPVAATPRDYLVNIRSSKFTVSSEVDMQINLDGEPLQGTKFTFEVIPKALNLHLPEDAPVLLGVEQ